MASHSVTKLTEEQYLALERAAEFKSEYFDGEMFAMSGASMQHGLLQGNIFGELYSALRGSQWKAFGSDLRIRVSGRDDDDHGKKLPHITLLPSRSWRPRVRRSASESTRASIGSRVERRW